jgi:RimJ/RimL family protein N-acetyltransferase
MSISALELMNLHVGALYVHNEVGQIVSVNEWTGGLVPRFFLGRTNVGNIWRFRDDVPDKLVNELTALCLEDTGDIALEPKHKEKYLELLAARETVTQIWQGPVYWCSQPVKPSVQPVAITEDNAHLLEGGLESWLPDVPHRQPFLATLQNGKAVSVCASVRITDAAHEAGVETLPAYRQKGYAASAVAGWANTLLAKNIIPLYSTSLENTASQNVARKVGFECFGVDFHVT